MADDPERGRDTLKTFGGVVLILVVGAALGIGWNAMGLASKPPRGLPWIAKPQATTSLESLQPPADRGALASTMVPPAPASSPAARADTSAGHAAKAVRPRATAPDPPRSRAAVATPASKHPATDSASAFATTRPQPAIEETQRSGDTPPAPATEMPVIPDVSGPLTVELAAFKRLYDAGAALVVDAREPATYEMGHIAGAISLPYNDALADRGRVEKLNAGGRPIVVYCSGGTCELSLDLAKFLAESGKRKLLVYEGGYHEWQAAGYPIVRGPAAGTSP